jgi:hypothetical protein
MELKLHIKNITISKVRKTSHPVPDGFRTHVVGIQWPLNHSATYVWDDRRMVLDKRSSTFTKIVRCPMKSSLHTLHIFDLSDMIALKI